MTVSINASVMEVARIMAERNIGSVVLINDAGRPVNIVTGRGLVRAIANGRSNAKANETGAGTDLLTATPGDVYQVLRRMRERSERHFIVTDRNGVVIGVLSIRDLLEDRAGDRAWWLLED